MKITIREKLRMHGERNTVGGIERLTLTVEEAAQLLGISRGLAYEMARSGKLPVVRFGRRLIVSKGALERMLDQPGDKSNP
jgi:excisionase family DNA binding protein